MKITESSFDKIRRIMEAMTDEESKRIYTFRLLYSLTGDRRYIYDMAKPLVERHRSEISSATAIAAEDYHLYEDTDLYRFVEKHKEQNRKLILFGAGAYGREVAYWLTCMGLHADAFCDNDTNKAGTMLDGLPVISFDELMREKQKKLVVITSIRFCEEIMEQLLENGFERSTICRYEHNSLLSYFGTSYFDSKIFQSRKDEVFIDGGAYCGETAYEFAQWCPEYKRIYSFEPDKRNYDRLIRRIKERNIRDVEAYEGGLWDKGGSAAFERSGDDGTGSHIHEGASEKINTYAIDDILCGKPVSYVKMDIEGAEYNALKGAEKTIREYRPRLAICIYHKPEDVIELPAYLLELVPEYRFTVRHYTTFLYDTILYAQICE